MSEIIQHLNWQFIAEEFLELVRDAEHNREQYDGLKTERDELKAEIDKWMKHDCEITEEYFKIRDQRDELKARLGKPEKPIIDDLPRTIASFIDLSAERVGASIPAENLRLGTFATPRIITADELKVGQVVAVHNVENADQVGHWEVVELHSEFWIGRAETNTDNIVLLEDAPEPEEPEQSLADQLCAISDDIRSGKRDTITWEQVKAELEVDDD